MTEKDPRKGIIKEISEIIDMSAELSVDKADELKDSLKLMSNCPCYENSKSEIESIKVKKKRAPTPRNEFMSTCMRSEAKGGEGKDVRTCSENWKKKKEVVQ